MQDAGCRMQDAGCGMQDAGCRMRDAGCGMAGELGYRGLGFQLIFVSTNRKESSNPGIAVDFRQHEQEKSYHISRVKRQDSRSKVSGSASRLSASASGY